MAISALAQLFRAVTPTKKPGDVTISYSQFSMWSNCPHKWKLNYIDRHRVSNPNINLIFGTSFHETLQYYIHTLYNKSIKEADQLDLAELLQEQLFNNYAVAVAENNNTHFSTATELQEYYLDGVEILKWIKKHRGDYFTNQGFELIAIEMPLYIQASDCNQKVILNGFLDIVIRDVKNDRIIIFDIKTSRGGWNAKTKKDKLKAAQLVLYKSYLAKQYGYSEDSIDIQYFIVKRKLIEGFMYPQKRVQIFEPASGKVTRKKLLAEVDTFIKTCFNPDGSYNVNSSYPALAGKGLSNCRYCEHATSGFCPVENRIKNVL